jgi:DNA (cytosine-5)-methyltransferase 1
MTPERIAELRESALSQGGWHHSSRLLEALNEIERLGQLVGPDRAFITKMFSGDDSSKSFLPSEPFGAMTCVPQQMVVATPFITEHYGQSTARSINEPLGTVATIGHHGLVDPQTSIDDCGFRMLTPDEIGRAQAFPDSYRVGGTKRDKTRQYGNAVSPPAAAILAERILEIL